MNVPLPGWPTLRAELRAMFGLAWPLALTNLSQHAMAMTDALILGRRSTEALAAATLGANLYWAVMALPLGAAFAAAAILARLRGAVGRGWVGRMRRGVQAGFAAALLVLAPGAVLLWQAEPVLLATGQTPALAAGAGLYLRCMVWALIPFSGFLVLRGFLAAMARPGPGLVVALVAILLVGRSRKMPVVRDDRIESRLMMPLSLSYDHRVIDGAAAARFLKEIIGYLESPGRLLLAM